MKIIPLPTGTFHAKLVVTESGHVYFSWLSDEETDRTSPVPPAFPLIQLHLSGDNQNDHHARKHLGGTAGAELKYISHSVRVTGPDTVLDIRLCSARIDATLHVLCRENCPVIQCQSEVTNLSQEPVGIEYLSSLSLWNIDHCGSAPRDRYLKLHLPANNWYGEAQWKVHTLPDLGLAEVNHFSLNRFSLENTGTWSSVGYLPCGMLENTLRGETLFWQTEHQGSWHTEIGDLSDHLYLHLSGPTENENQWWKSLAPGEAFTSVPVATGLVTGDTGDALAALTEYRRTLLRPCADLERLPVIFNDYMNCLSGDPTTEKLFPLIDAAADAGCEVFCIDCGWYDDGPWWEGVGAWLPSRQRFPGGIQEPLDHIRAKGMVPGLWLELEVMGTACPLAAELPDECFFMRHGKRVTDHHRYQLDFRHPQVRAHATRVIDRLVDEYGVGYIKMDYNINAGAGTEVAADSFGDGLLEHNRSYIRWLESVFAKYPDLVIENCGSGGLRMDYSLLKWHSIQSVSDQTDYRLMSVIAASAASAATPEQCAIWSYPLRDGDEEEVITNMVNAMLLRIHQSGHLAELTPSRFARVKEGIAVYKTLRQDIPGMTPFWPLGMPSFSSSWLAFGLRDERHMYLAVWRQNAREDICQIPLPDGCIATDVSCLYPEDTQGKCRLSADNRSLNIFLPRNYMARLFVIPLE